MAIYNFIDPVAADGTAGVLQAAGQAFVSNNAGDIGLWNVGTGSYMSTGGAAFAATDFLTDTWSSIVELTNPAADGTETDLNVQQVAIVPEQFQVTQQRSSGQPFMTPIIKRGDVKSIEYRINVNSVLASISSTITTPAIGDWHELKFRINSVPLNYREVESSTTLGAYPRVGQIINVTVPKVTVTNEDTDDTGLGDVAKDAIANHNIMGKLVDVTYTDGTNVLLITAKSVGFDFDMVSSTGYDTNDDAATSHIPTGTKTQPIQGEGEVEAVRGFEEKSLANFGYHNRLWFKQTPDLFGATAATNGIVGFDLIQIKAKVDGYGGNIGKKGREDIVVNIWWDQAANGSSADLMDVVFRFTYGTNRKHEFNYSGVSQPTSNTGAGI